MAGASRTASPSILILPLPTNGLNAVLRRRSAQHLQQLPYHRRRRAEQQAGCPGHPGTSGATASITILLSAAPTTATAPPSYYFHSLSGCRGDDRLPGLEPRTWVRIQRTTTPPSSITWGSTCTTSRTSIIPWLLPTVLQTIPKTCGSPCANHNYLLEVLALTAGDFVWDYGLAWDISTAVGQVPISDPNTVPIPVFVSVPLPGTVYLLSTGFLVLVGFRRKFRS